MPRMCVYICVYICVYVSRFVFISLHSGRSKTDLKSAFGEISRDVFFPSSVSLSSSAVLLFTINDLPQPRFLFFDSPSGIVDEAALNTCFCGCCCCCCCCCWLAVGVVDVSTGAGTVAGAGAAEEAAGTTVGVVDSERLDDDCVGGGVCEDALFCGLSVFTTCGHDPMLLLLSWMIFFVLKLTYKQKNKKMIITYVIYIYYL